jgi:hypothetical protein
MRRLASGRGDTKLGCLLWLVGLGMAAYIGFQAVPAQVNASELKKFMIGIAEHRAEEPIERIEAAVLARVEDLELPVDKKQVHAERVGGRIRISYRYTVPIDLVVTTYDWNIEVKIDRLIVIT